MNTFEMLNKFQEFKRTFQGDPRAQVQQLLDSGQMSEEQFQKLSQMATQLQRFLQG